jgi:hypothetical protein
MTATNPTAAEFAAMVAELHDAERAGREAMDTKSPAHARDAEAYSAILNARPSDPAVLAAQIRWLASEQDDGDNEGAGTMLEHVAEQLEAIAPRAPSGELAELWRRRQEIARTLSGDTSDWDEEEYEAELDLQIAIEDRILAVEARTLDECILQIRTALASADNGNREYEAALEAIAKIVDRLEALPGGRRHG